MRLRPRGQEVVRCDVKHDPQFPRFGPLNRGHFGRTPAFLFRVSRDPGNMFHWVDLLQSLIIGSPYNNFCRSYHNATVTEVLWYAYFGNSSRFKKKVRVPLKLGKARCEVNHPRARSVLASTSTLFHCLPTLRCYKFVRKLNRFSDLL